MMNSLPWTYPPSASERPQRARRLAAALLRTASDRLASVALRLAVQESRAAPESAAPVLEFHAEAGAPEGALYVDGRFVGHIVGVRRL